MLFAVVVFPGSNCDHDVYHVAKHVLGCAARYVWHKDRDLRGADVVVLPGAMRRNDSLKYVCRDVNLKVENAMTPWTRKYAKGEVIRIPIGHGDGNYFIDGEGLKRVEGEGQVAFRYVGKGGERGAPGSNPNGSLADIAGVTNARGNVLGMMPHPERLAEEVLGGEDGRRLFESILEAVG